MGILGTPLSEMHLLTLCLSPVSSVCSACLETSCMVCDILLGVKASFLSEGFSDPSGASDLQHRSKPVQLGVCWMEELMSFFTSLPKIKHFYPIPIPLPFYTQQWCTQYQCSCLLRNLNGSADSLKPSSNK